MVKQFQPSVHMTEKSKHELRMLSLLRHVNHPHIVRFHAAYTLDCIPHFIFDAADYDLLHLLSDCRPDTFTDQVIFHEIYGIASAIDALHNYFSDELNLHLIGCHYDLKPDNILVRGTQFLLSDFGLSRMKTAAEGSGSYFKGGLADYLAPECQDLQGTLDKNRIRRPSDIWSFGCILAELATWMRQGPTGVNNFVAKREMTFQGVLTVHQFHAGNEPSEAVSEWLNGFQGSAVGLYWRGLVKVIQDMLSFAAADRPKSNEVMVRLFQLHTRIVYEELNNLLSIIATRLGLWIIVEQRRFEAWAWCGLESLGSDLHLGANSDTALRAKLYGTHDILQCLKADLLQLNASDDEELASVTFSYQHAIRTHTGKLWGMHSISTLKRMTERTEELLLTHHSEILSSIEDSEEKESALLESALLKVTMKQVSTALEDSSRRKKKMNMDRNFLKVTGNLQGKQTGHLSKFDNQKTVVVIEYLEYADHWIDRSEELVERVNGLACELSDLKASGSLPVLKCEGFCHIPERQAFQLIFSVPDEAQANLKPVTLVDIIKKTGPRNIRPSLDEVFLLAWILTNTIFTFHQAGWYHKSIASGNVLFFPRDPNYPTESVTSPYLTGFNYSRQDGRGAFTVGPSPDPKAKDYQHPEYQDHAKFQRRFDYYSLGVILLELGRWKPLEHMIRGKSSQSPTQIRNLLLENELPQVASQMGQLYRDAVWECLKESSNEIEDDPKVLERFKEKVRQPMEQCLALLQEKDVQQINVLVPTKTSKVAESPETTHTQEGGKVSRFL